MKGWDKVKFDPKYLDAIGELLKKQPAHVQAEIERVVRLDQKLDLEREARERRCHEVYEALTGKKWKPIDGEA